MIPWEMLWRMPVAGGQPEKFLEPCEGALYSPDGRLLAYATEKQEDPELVARAAPPQQEAQPEAVDARRERGTR